jgi:26S proteasome non-ATPase regulatory subunit 9
MASFSGRDRLNRLIAQREALELEADAIASELNSPGPNGELPAGIKSPLVDGEGFPRGDIDLFNVRSKRQRLAIINTDYKALMSEIEVSLQEVLRTDTTATEVTSSSTAATTTAPVTVSSKAIAIIDEILDGSPASTAGMLDGDELLKFGPVVTADTTDALNAIPGVVRDNVNQRISITVRRKGALVSVVLVPKTWSGRGLLGCHLTPITQM